MKKFSFMPKVMAVFSLLVFFSCLPNDDIEKTKQFDLQKEVFLKKIKDFEIKIDEKKVPDDVIPTFQFSSFDEVYEFLKQLNDRQLKNYNAFKPNFNNEVNKSGLSNENLSWSCLANPSTVSSRVSIFYPTINSIGNPISHQQMEFLFNLTYDQTGIIGVSTGLTSAGPRGFPRAIPLNWFYNWDPNFGPTGPEWMIAIVEYDVVNFISMYVPPSCPTCDDDYTWEAYIGEKVFGRWRTNGCTGATEFYLIYQ